MTFVVCMLLPQQTFVTAISLTVTLVTTAGVTGTDLECSMEMLHPGGAQDLLRILITAVLFLLGCKTSAVKKVQATTSISDIDFCRLHFKLRWMSYFWEAKITLRFKGGQFSGSPANAIQTHLRIHETDSKRFIQYMFLYVLLKCRY